jgi:uncharacterized protein (TIGR03083 family)
MALRRTALKAARPAPLELSTETRLRAIDRHCVSLANIAGSDLGAPVRHCPGWSMADLVHHVTDVHWFWTTIAAERLDAPPDGSRRPPRAPDDELLATFRAGATRMTEVLAEAKPKASCWTWAPAHQDIGFIIRHQVQEAAVHHWDAADALGRGWAVTPAVAADCVDEFLEVSLHGRLDGAFSLHSGDTGHSWTVTDGADGPEVERRLGMPPRPKLTASSGGLLLWLYRRIDLAYDAEPEQVARFRALPRTD